MTGKRTLAELPDDWWKHEGAVRQLCTYLEAHVVGLAVGYNLAGKRHLQLFSGFTVDHLGGLYWVTAAHVLERIEALLTTPDVHIASQNWVDSHRMKVPTTIPTSLRDLDFRRGDPDEVDLGFARFNNNEEDLLRANPDFLTFNEQSWIGNHTCKPEGYYLIGFPEEWTQFSVNENGRASTINFTTDVVGTPLVDIIDSTKEDQARLDGFWSRKHCLYARVALGTDAATSRLKSLRGTSGGPILSVERTLQDRIAYRPIAVQSAWLPDQGIIRAEPFLLVVGAIERLFHEPRTPVAPPC